MRLLFREKGDSSLKVIEAIEIAYDPELEELYASTATTDFVCCGVDKGTADKAISLAFEKGFVDCSTLYFEYDEDAVEGDERVGDVGEMRLS